MRSDFLARHVQATKFQKTVGAASRSSINFILIAIKCILIAIKFILITIKFILF